MVLYFNFGIRLEVGLPISAGAPWRCCRNARGFLFNVDLFNCEIISYFLYSLAVSLHIVLGYIKTL